MAGPTQPDSGIRSRRLLQRVLVGPIPRGPEFDACRAVLQGAAGTEVAFQAVCMLLEGALADPRLDIDDAQDVVRLLRDLAAGIVTPGELL